MVKISGIKEKSKIESITVTHVSIPLIKPYTASLGTILTSEAIIVKMTTKNGNIGVGEADPLPPFTQETIDSIKVHIKSYLGPAILGSNIFELNTIRNRMDKILSGNPFAKSALEIAIYDLIGKELNVPLYELFGGAVREEIPIIWPLGSASIEETVKEAVEAVKRGFNTIAIKIAALPVEEDIKRIKAVREAVGDDVKIIVDANEGWSFTEAVKFIKATRDCSIEFLEQPLSRWDVDGLARLSSLGMPLSADESLFSVQDATRLIEKRAVSVFSIKTCKHGGLSNARKIMILAESFGISCFMNSMIEMGVVQAASLHLGVSSYNLYDSGHCYMSTLRISDDVTDLGTQIDLGKCTIKVTDKPGLGIQLDAKKLEKYAKDEFKIGD